MKVVIISVVAILVLSGCAMSQPKTKFVTDKDYIGQVEAAAKHRGVDVVWVNPPVRRIERKDDK
ncbi:hypothetical protein [Permianibacter aggregans]|uniref:Uncharacterized protein n=1 Tax=Permianibacter aggregans TaxID=1510150 RepID=A0A4V3D878_9GAMM|nr:hypothetical protein [Permianibacter aggregans]QGX38792.1 hypothetical protein E2H98_03600 [Permianibacter aggregans]TDQ50597.1 hypothetical protein EV696_102280 [Permianibacter aggregans]